MKVKGKTVALTRADFLEKTREQLNFLIKSAKAYDAGDHAEATRMATSLRVLLNSSGKSNIALLKHLRAVDWRFMNTAGPYSPTNILTHTGLVALSATESEARFIPLVASGLRSSRIARLSYSDWWREAIVLRDASRNEISRWQLVDWVANQDGGAHVDAEVSEAYFALKRLSGSGWMTSVNGNEQPVQGVIDASIRQIAHECIWTFQRKLPQLLPSGAYQA